MSTQFEPPTQKREFSCGSILPGRPAPSLWLSTKWAMTLAASVGAALGSLLTSSSTAAIASDAGYEALLAEVTASTEVPPRHEAARALLSRSRSLGVVPLRALPYLMAGDDLTRDDLALYLAKVIPEMGNDWRRMAQASLDADDSPLTAMASGLSPSVAIQPSMIEKAGHLPQDRAENAIDAIADGVYPTLEFARGVADLVRSDSNPLRKLGAVASLRLGVNVPIAVHVLIEDRAERTGSRGIDLLLINALETCPVDWAPAMQSIVIDFRSLTSLGRVLLSRPSLCSRAPTLTYTGLSSQSFEVRCDYACSTARCGVPAMVRDAVDHLVPLFEQALDREDKLRVERLLNSIACTGTTGRPAIPALLRNIGRIHRSTIEDVVEAISACADPTDEPAIVEAAQRSSDDQVRRALDRTAKRVRDGLRPKLTDCGPR